jgi:hypothetical protein
MVAADLRGENSPKSGENSPPSIGGAYDRVLTDVQDASDGLKLAEKVGRGRLGVLGIGNIPNVSGLEAKSSRLLFSQSVYNRCGHKIGRCLLIE